MSSFHDFFYSSRKSEVLDSFYQETQETEKFRFKEIAAAVQIQALFRMHRQRKTYLEEVRAVNLIKRIYRGYRTRKGFWGKIQQALSLQMRKFYDSSATAIQRVYKGYYSRRYYHDFYARKKYLEHIQNKNEKRLRKLEEYRREQDAEDQKRQEDYARLEFYKLASSLHHLTSTRAIPGVYKALEEVSDFGKHSLRVRKS